MGESSNTGHIETTVLTTVLYDGRLQANDGQYSNNGYQNTVQLNTDGNGNVDTNRFALTWLVALVPLFLWFRYGVWNYSSGSI